MNDSLKIQKLEEINTSKLLNRNTRNEKAMDAVKGILAGVESRGIDAILEYTEIFDGVRIRSENVKVTSEEIEEAYSKLNKKQLGAIRESINRVKALSLKQIRPMKQVISKSRDGETRIRWLPIKRAGIYVPAGKAPLASSLLMAAIPAQVAGVGELIVCSPPQKDGRIDPSILVTANECGITELYKIGGAQAIGSLAYGCEVFEKVDLISGPGNIYVAYAKQQVAGKGLVKIDTTAGPSEVLIIADETANPKFIAADMLAQAEHGANSSSVCVTTSNWIAEKVKEEIKNQVATLPNRDGIAQALQEFGAIILVNSISEAISFANEFAPEHVEIFAKDADRLAERITEAGAVFIGTSEVFGDYGMTGANHILPTGRAAKFSSGVTVFTFLKCQFVQRLSANAQLKLAGKTAEFARIEKLEAHARAAEERLR